MKESKPPEIIFCCTVQQPYCCIAKMSGLSLGVNSSNIDLELWKNPPKANHLNGYTDVDKLIEDIIKIEKSRLSVVEKEVDDFFSKSAPLRKLVKDSQKTGTRSVYLHHRLDEIPFVDLDFINATPDYLKYHREVVFNFKPEAATVLDIMEEDMIDGAVKEAEIFHKHGVTPIVIPRVSGALKHIPPYARIGYAMMTNYKQKKQKSMKFLSLYVEDIESGLLEGREIHLLGGNPIQQYKWGYKFRKEAGAILRSVDGSMQMRLAGFAQMWNAERKAFIDFDGGRERGFIYKCFAKSCKEIKKFWEDAWKEDVNVFDIKDDVYGYVEEDLL